MWLTEKRRFSGVFFLGCFSILFINYVKNSHLPFGDGLKGGGGGGGRGGGSRGVDMSVVG